MADIRTVRELLQHMEWADARVWVSAFALPAALTDSIIRDRLFHIHVVQRVFHYVWLAQPLPQFPEQSNFPDATAVATLGRQAHDNIKAFIERVDEVTL